MSFWYQNGVCSNNRHSRRRNRKKLSYVTAGMTSALAFAVVAQAQDRAPPGLIASFDIEQRLEYSDNPDLDVDGDSEFFGRTLLRFGLDSFTPTERFSLNLGSDIEEGRKDEPTFNFVVGFADLAYERDVRNSSFGVGLNYRETDNSEFSDEEFDDDGNVINQNDGTRRSYRAGVDFAVGVEAPVGAEFSWSYREINYSSDSDPDSNDRKNNEFSGRLNFRHSPVLSTSLTGRYADFDAEGNGVDRETTSVGAGMSYALSPILTTDLGLSYDRIDRSGDESGTEEGVSVRAGLQRELSNGTIGVEFTSDIVSSGDGRRSYLGISRDMELPRGDLAFTIGATGEDVVGTDPLVNVQYRYLLPTAVLQFDMRQDVFTDENNREQINTNLRLSYDQEVNNRSRFGVSLGIFDRNELQDDANDGRRINFDLTYTRELTRDWNLVSGYRHSFSDEDDRKSATSNTVFVGLSRSFDWRP